MKRSSQKVAKIKIVQKNAYMWLSEAKEVLQNKVFNTVKNPKYDGYQRVYKSFWFIMF